VTAIQTPQEVIPQLSLRRKVEELSGEKITACFQCEKCTNGCPVTFAMDIMPHQVLRLLGLGQIEEVLLSDTIWVCASCEMCATRCPNDISIAHIMDTMRQMSQREGPKASQKNVPIFHAAFLGSIRRFGRVHEAFMSVEFYLRSSGVSGLLQQAGTGLSMFNHGKIKIMPYRLLGNRQVRSIFKRTIKKG